MNEQEFEKQLNALHERVLSKALSDEEKNNDIVNIGLHFFLKDVRPMLPPVMNRSIVDAIIGGKPPLAEQILRLFQ